MPKKKITALSDIISPTAPQGTNDPKWFLVEHQLEQCKMSAQVVVGTLSGITQLPENENERQVAADCLDITKRMARHILEAYATFLSYISDTNVPEKISRMEV